MALPSFAPVVIVTSFSGSNSRPKNGEYEFAIAFFSRGRPFNQVSHAEPTNLSPGISYLGRRVLIALHLVQRVLRGVEDELRRIISEEALPHVDNRLHGGGRGRFIDNGPVYNQPGTP